MGELSPQTTAALAERLGIGPFDNDLDGLRAVYRAWCLGVPFDNLRKMNAMFRDPAGPLPDLRAEAFCEAFLEHGTGATCWPHAEALYQFLRGLGFDARRGAGSMWDFGDPNHGTTLVHLADGSVWMLDNAMLHLEPLRLDARAPGVHGDPVHFAEVEVAGEDVFVHGTHPPMPDIFFRLIERDVPGEAYAERWANARSTGPFNERVHIRRNTPDAIRTIRGNTLFIQDAGGVRTETLDADSLVGHLKGTMALHPAFVDAWAASGALESSLKPAGAPPAFPVRRAPRRPKPAVTP